MSVKNGLVTNSDHTQTNFDIWVWESFDHLGHIVIFMLGRANNNYPSINEELAKERLNPTSNITDFLSDWERLVLECNEEIYTTALAKDPSLKLRVRLWCPIVVLGHDAPNYHEPLDLPS